MNGKIKLGYGTRVMIFDIPFLINYISQYFRLEHGDLILTDTPASVSAVKHGDEIEAELGENLARIKLPVVKL